jgi:pimeloyl-ACP methyl ester carboxylesterase/DNA-binding CsgD family transcriptional regulator
MTDPTTDPASSNPDSSDPAGKDQLIESIYRIALEPQTYDNFMGHWDEYISQRLGALETLQAAPETLNETERYPEIASHFEIASRLLEQMEHKAPGLSEPQQSGTSEPQFLIDASGRIIWFNSAASTAFNLSKTSTIDSLDLPELQADGLAKMSASLLNPGAQTAPLILKLNSADPASRPHYLYARVLPEQQGEDIILVSKVTPDWPPEMHALLTSGFNLSKSEIDICALIADGQGAAQIAEIRTSALATVRTQIKRIMAKTSCSTQSELVRLLHSVMRVAEDNAKSQTPAHLSPERTLYVNLPDRVMPVEQFGDPNGAPVIFFHGMLDGNTMTHEAQALLRLHKLRLICPVRPWFGAAAGTGIPVADAPEAFARDVLEMIAQLQLQAPVLLGHMAGSVYAHAAATAAASAAPSGHPARDIKGIVIVSGGVPIVSLSQFSTMSTRQRLVAYTARFTPKMLPFVLRAGISQMESGGSKTFMRSLYETAPHDLALVADPEIASIIFTGYRFTVQQGHRAFEIDSFHVVSNWSHWLDGNTVPIQVLHGRTDPVVSLPSVEVCYASRSERAKLEVLEECGQLILYQHPDKVIDAILDIMAHPQA